MSNNPITGTGKQIYLDDERAEIRILVLTKYIHRNVINEHNIY